MKWLIAFAPPATKDELFITQQTSRPGLLVARAKAGAGGLHRNDAEGRCLPALSGQASLPYRTDASASSRPDQRAGKSNKPFEKRFLPDPSPKTSIHTLACRFPQRGTGKQRVMEFLKGRGARETRVYKNFPPEFTLLKANWYQFCCIASSDA